MSRPSVSFVARCAEFVRDALFPVFCASCGAEGEWWCRPCRAKMQSGEPGFASGAKGFLDGSTALFPFQHPLPGLIHNFKYAGGFESMRLWKSLIVGSNLSPEGVIIPVPLHPRRERERGYNQAWLLAKCLAEKNNRELLVGALRRVRYTDQQAKLKDSLERASNVHGAFMWAGDTTPDSVVLVDDVITSGSTMNECARVLKEAGVKRVVGWVLCHAGHL